MTDDGLRTWLKQADELGEIRTIEGADWDLEIGGVTDILTERGKSPAVLFDSIKGFPKGRRVLVNSLGSTKRLGLCLGMPQNLSAMDRCWRISNGMKTSICWRFRRRAGLNWTAGDTSAQAA